MRATKSRERGKRRESRQGAGRRRPRFIEGLNEVDYKDYELLKKFVTDRGKILPRRLSGANAQQQRQIKRAVRRARVIGWLP